MAAEEAADEAAEAQISQEAVESPKDSNEIINSDPEYLTSGRSPQRVPFSEIADAMNGFTNMHLAHEISINHDFRIQPMPPDTTT